MTYKTVTTVLISTERLAQIVEAAAEVARQFDAHLEVLCLGLDRTQPGFYYAGANAMVFQDNLAQARETAGEIETAARAALEGRDIAWSADAMTAQSVALNGLIAHRTRFSDLVVLAQPYGEGKTHEDEAIVEAALFDGHVPVLIVPDGQTIPETIDTAIVAWNESAEALQATRAALPFLNMADKAVITVIDPPKHGPERSDPGGLLAQMLSRHGVRPEISVLAMTMPRVSDILNRQVADRNAQLLVMGAYGHSRFRESIMGGATRHLLEVSDVPVLMAH